MSALRLNEILNRLSGVKSVGREHYLALCPCHDDHRPSLDIAVKNNKILMCCPVCGADGVKVMQTLGLNARDLFDDSKRERPERPASVDYYYSDKLKKTRFYVWDDKTQGWSKSFCWYHKGERGQQVKGLPKDSDGRSISPPLYHQEFLIVARERQETVYIVEGEKDVNTLVRLGRLAVCSPHGAGKGRLENKWPKAYSALFEGLNVVILHDNDEAGLNLAQYVAGQLHPVAKSVRLPDLTAEWSDLPEKGDISDIVERSSKEDTNARLDKLIESTKLWQPPKEKSLCICLSDVESTETKWLWYPYIPLGKITLMTADPGTGKTFFALYLVAQTSKGAPFYGTTIPWQEPARAVYLSAEDGLADTIKPRLEPMKPIFDNIYSYDESEKSLSLSDSKIEEIMQKLHPKLIVFDPLQAYIGADVDMHRANEVRPVLGRIGRLADKYSCAVIFIMHNSKATQNAALQRALGSMDIPAIARSMLILANDPEGGRLLCHEKSSLAARGQSICFDVDPSKGGIVFSGYSDLRADDVLTAHATSRNKSRKKRDELCDDLLELFGDEDRLRVDSIEKLCEQLGCSRNTLYRARDELQIKSVVKGFGKDRTAWWLLNDTSLTEP